MRVADDGPGLPSEQAEVAFDRFVNLDGNGGSGLGLAIARELARAHGGDLIYEDGAFVVNLRWRPGTATDPALVPSPQGEEDLRGYVVAVTSIWS